MQVEGAQGRHMEARIAAGLALQILSQFRAHPGFEQARAQWLTLQQVREPSTCAERRIPRISEFAFWWGATSHVCHVWRALACLFADRCWPNAPQACAQLVVAITVCS